jgi:hypothetical protein
LFKAGCAIAAVVMGVSLFLPYFSINLSDYYSRSFSLISIIIEFYEGSRGFFGFLVMSIGRRWTLLDQLGFGTLAATFLLAFNILVLFFVSFSNNKATKVTLGIASAISMASVIFGTRAILLREIQNAFTGNAFFDSFGIAGVIARSVGSIFDSIFKFEVGIWVLLHYLCCGAIQQNKETLTFIK